MSIIIQNIIVLQNSVTICKMADFCGKLKDMRGFDTNVEQFTEDAKGRSSETL